MNFGDEIQSAQNLRELEDAENVPLSDRELSVARRLVESISESFDITKYHDNYREALLDLIDRKAAGEEIVVEPHARREPTATPDLMGALEASLEEVRQRQGAGAGAAAKKNGAAKGSGAKKAPAKKALAKKATAKKTPAKRPAAAKPTKS
jgi:DNA end-binding protein Ku